MPHFLMLPKLRLSIGLLLVLLPVPGNVSMLIGIRSKVGMELGSKLSKESRILRINRRMFFLWLYFRKEQPRMGMDCLDLKVGLLKICHPLQHSA